MKKIVITHTDFRIYWPARLKALEEELISYGIELYVIEIAGKGSPYAFAQRADMPTSHWITLFPHKEMEELFPSEIKSRLIAQFEKINPDVIAAGAIAFPSGAIAAMWAKKHKKGIVIFDDAKMEDVPRGRITNFIKKRIYRNIDAIMYPAYTWDETGLYWGFRKEQIFYGVDVVDNSFWKITAEEKIGLKSVIIGVGRQIERKNMDFLIRAFQQSNNANYELILVGDGAENEKLRQLAKEDSHIKFYPFLPQKELRELYKTASALVTPSKFETWGLVINEAMAAGLPVIASNKCPAAEILVKQGKNGYVFSPNNTESLKDTLNTFFSLTRAQQASMGKQSEKIISQWGLNKFSSEMFSAANYAYHHKKKCKNILDKIILTLWKGRYRQA